MLNECFKAYEAGGYSPVFLGIEDIEPGTIVVAEEDDSKRLEFARLQVQGSGKKVEVYSLFLYLTFLTCFFAERHHKGRTPTPEGSQKRDGRRRSAILRRTSVG